MNARVVVLLLLAAAGFAKEPKYPDRPDGVKEFVVDEADLVAAGDRDEINRLAQDLFGGYDIVLMVVTVPSLARYDAGRRNIEWYARKLFDAWEIGSREHNFGILLLVAREDRKARIELGAGWAHRKDGAARKIMNERIVPSFRDGEFSRGIRLGVEALVAIARDQAIPALPRPWWWTAIWVALALLFLGVLNSLLQHGVDGWGYKAVMFVCLAPFWIFAVLTPGLDRRRRYGTGGDYGADYGGWGGGGFGGGGGGGFGGGGGSGGFSGGGGATGSW